MLLTCPQFGSSSLWLRAERICKLLTYKFETKAEKFTSRSNRDIIQIVLCFIEVPQQKVTVETLNVKLQCAVSVQGNIKGQSIIYFNTLHQRAKKQVRAVDELWVGVMGQAFFVGCRVGDR